MNFCSNCGVGGLEFKIPEGDNLPRYCCNNCNTIHYQNPNVVVGAIAIWQEKILLARRNIEPRKGFWNLPCGFLELYETVEEGAKREVLEETGANIELETLQTIYNLPDAQQLYIIFKSRMLNGSINTTAESSEVKLFAVEEIPWNQIAFSSNTFALKAFLSDLKAGKSTVHFGTFKKSKPNK